MAGYCAKGWSLALRWLHHLIGRSSSRLGFSTVLLYKLSVFCPRLVLAFTVQVQFRAGPAGVYEAFEVVVRSGSESWRVLRRYRCDRAYMFP